ncbi:MAG: hypothetical protein HKP37_02510 [Boseongicola sp.]|nr:hypothetical protein [Boseongicola sp.]
MVLGLIGLGMMLGTVAATLSLMSGGSLLAALGVYALSGILVSLSVASAVAVRAKRQDQRGDYPYMAITPAE